MWVCCAPGALSAQSRGYTPFSNPLEPLEILLEHRLRVLKDARRDLTRGAAWNVGPLHDHVHEHILVCSVNVTLPVVEISP